MSVELPFARSRPVAMHCPELIDRHRAAKRARLVELADRVAACLEPRIARFFGAASIRIACSVTVGACAADVLSTCERQHLVAVFRHSRPECEIAAVVGTGDAGRLVARLFGGAGDARDDGTDGGTAEVPLSARLLARQLYRMVGEALEEVAGDDTGALTWHLHKRGDPAPLSQARRCDVLDLTVSQPQHPEWSIRLVCAPAAWPNGSGAPCASGGRHTFPGDASPFADIPFLLQAVCAEIPLPLPRLAALRVGEVLPLRMHREVSVRVADLPIAGGVAGAVEGERSLQLARVFGSSTHRTELLP